MAYTTEIVLYCDDPDCDKETLISITLDCYCGSTVYEWEDLRRGCSHMDHREDKDLAEEAFEVAVIETIEP